MLAGALWRSCCWPGRRGGESSGISCCRGAVAKQLLAGNRWHRGLPAGALKRSSMGKSLLLRRRRCGCIGKSLPLHGRRCGCIGKPTNSHKKRRARKRPKYLSRAASIYSLAKGQHAMRRGRTAVHRRHALQAKLPTAFTSGIHRRHSVLAQLPLQLCRDCKEGCSKCKNCVELWEYGKDKGVTEYVLSV